MRHRVTTGTGRVIYDRYNTVGEEPEHWSQIDVGLNLCPTIYNWVKLVNLCSFLVKKITPLTVWGFNKYWGYEDSMVST